MCGRDERSVPGYSTPSRSTLKSLKTRISSYTALSATHCQPLSLSHWQSTSESFSTLSPCRKQISLVAVSLVALAPTVWDHRTCIVLRTIQPPSPVHLHKLRLSASLRLPLPVYPQAQACLATPLRWHDPSYKLLQSIMLLPTSSLGSSPLATPVRSRRSLPLHGTLFL